MIEITNVSKTLKGNLILKKISYSFESGKIYGIHGHNGSGKTMLLRTMSGLLIPDEGSIHVGGKRLYEDIEFPESIGIIIESMQMLSQYNAFENLKILSKIRKKASDEDIYRAIQRVGLEENKKIVKKYSLGMKQRLNIAQAIFEKPDIILLDEPTNAIDQKGVKEIYNLLMEEKARGAVIIVASHHKEDFDAICDVSVEMRDGEIVDEEK